MITDPRDLAPELLTEILRRQGVLDKGRVERVGEIFSRTLTVSRVARLKLEYSPDSTPSSPRTLFLKLSQPQIAGPPLTEVSAEVRFYQSVGAEMKGPPLVRCFDAGVSPDGSSSYLLMEDLSESHFQPPAPEPPPEFRSQHAVRCLARFHARWWDHPGFGRSIGKVFDEEWLEGFLADLENSVDRFISAAGDKLSPARRQIYRRMVDSGPKIWGRLTDPTGLTVAHGDTHWWNFLYPHDPEADEVRLLDWQLWHIDLGARDLAFLVALGGFAERRPLMEESLIRQYHETLTADGLREYPWDDFFHDYRISVIRNLNLAVIFWSQGRSEDLWTGTLERAFAAFDDLNCSDLL